MLMNLSTEWLGQEVNYFTFILFRFLIFVCRRIGFHVDITAILVFCSDPENRSIQDLREAKNRTKIIKKPTIMLWFCRGKLHRWDKPIKKWQRVTFARMVMVRIKMRRSRFYVLWGSLKIWRKSCRNAKSNRENIAFNVWVEFIKLDRVTVQYMHFFSLWNRRETKRRTNCLSFFFSKIKPILTSLNKEPPNRTEQSFEQAENRRLSSPRISESSDPITKQRD